MHDIQCLASFYQRPYLPPCTRRSPKVKCTPKNYTPPAQSPQLEVIYTVSNDSNARTEWRSADSTLVSLCPPPNSLIAVRADAAWHRVVPATEGERVIIKALYTADFAKTDAFAETIESAPWRR